MDWMELDRELAAWTETGRTATFWWRDDDAGAPNAALERLLGLAEARPVPLALAAIPADTGPALAALLRAFPAVTILQHGYAHRNHAPAGAKKAELGPHRPLGDMAGELIEGRRQLRTLFGTRFRTVLVPPWNRIDPALAAELPRLGYAGLSTYGGAGHGTPPELAVADTHIDVVDWRNGRRFIGEPAALRLAVRHLAARRRGEAPLDEATGLLTHHRVQDSEGWQFIEAFIARTAEHPAVRWLDAAALFDPKRVTTGDPAHMA